MPPEPADPRPALAARVAREAEFFDRLYSGQSSRQAVQHYYANELQGWRCYSRRFTKDLPGQRVLWCGSGDGSYVYQLADKGAEVSAVDISAAAVELGRSQFRPDGASVDFSLQDVHQLAFPDANFDRIGGTGILHHLDLEAAYAELARVLKPGGFALFYEPLGHNPLINWYRRRTPELRTADERPLRWRDIELARRQFANVTVTAFHLCTLPVLHSRHPLARTLLAAGSAADRALFALLPFARRYAWLVVVELAQPARRAG